MRSYRKYLRKSNFNKMNMEYKVKLLQPMMPNFISIKQPPRPSGLNEIKIRVCELTNEEAEQYGEEMKHAFIKHHKESVAREKNKK